MIIAIASTKGGVGKSTLSMHFTHALQLLFPSKRVLLMDADPQSTCVNWGSWRAEQQIKPFIDVQPVKEDGMLTILEERLKIYDFIIIDVGGADNPNLRRSLVHVNAVIVPSSLEPAERIHTLDMMELVSFAKKEYNPKIKTFMIFNQVKATGERKYVQEFKTDFPDFVYWLDGFIMHRVWFSRVYGKAKTVFDLLDNEEDVKAKSEINHALYQVLDQLGVKYER